jgi:Putative DNA-binding domain
MGTRWGIHRTENHIPSYSFSMLQENYTLVTGDELIRKVSDTENNFIERKTCSNTDGWVKTAVAFANSCPIGQPGILYVNVDDGGEVISQPAGYDFEKLQKSISKKILEAWPPIYFVTHVLNKNGLEFVAVVIWGSPLRPHFSGPAYVRVGPETRDASDEEYDKLIAQRSSKVRALLKLVGKTVYWESLSPTAGNANGTVLDCNQFFVTIDGGTYQRCFPVDWITISFDPNNKRYCLIVKD